MKQDTIRIISRLIMIFAAIYNVLWGVLICIHPKVILFDESDSIFVFIILQCVGMLIGLYGVAYYFASRDPARYWPIVLIGLISKILGPIGSLHYIFTNQLDASFFWVNVFNDLIWIVPFGWILYHVYKRNLEYIEEEEDDELI